ncbi:hypothetical protein H1R20_g14734, partial [Candolleomyces eurysporus]
MAAHLAIAYTCPAIGSQDSLPKSLLSRVWGEEFTMHGIPYHDDMQVELAERFDNFGAPRHEQSLKASTSASDREDALSQIKDVPLEILYEILIHLNPSDLLTLSRSNRRLREILLNKSSRFIWKECLASVRGLPRCPPYMTEPQFSNLVFDESCHFCGGEGVKDVFWTCHVRCCSKCIKQQFVSEEELDSQIPEEVHVDKCASVFPYIVVNQYQPKQPTKALYYLPTAAKYLAELKDVVASQGSEGVDAWVKSKKASQISRIKFASLCEHWYNHWAARSIPRHSELPLFDLAVTAVLSSALIYLWKDRIFS